MMRNEHTRRPSIAVVDGAGHIHSIQDLSLYLRHHIPRVAQFATIRRIGAHAVAAQD